ncbi:MBL fold metallo-hydrolase [Nocardia concava]|uniref:MBL fold metallo-hydrolase n=1 Tax=Nocardia concava TaxID=257281 RepID=UPI0003030160|nr:MBL fold metallo-hydrolase [Nocardia concava]
MSGLDEVADGVFAYIERPGGWCVSNAALIRKGRETILVDTLGTERRARGLHSAITYSGFEMPEAVVNTHWHGDHTAGNALFAPAPVVAHRACQAAMARNGLAVRALWPDIEWGELPLTLPRLGVGDEAVLHIGSREVHLLTGGVGHTDADLAVWVPDAAVVVAGDLVMPGCTPFLLSGSVLGSLNWLDRLTELSPVTVIGGHGEVADHHVLAETRAYLDWLLAVARDARSSGATPLEAARQVDPTRHDHHPWSSWSEPERLVANLYRAYAEVADAAEFTHIRSGPVLADMAAYLGRKLATSA